MVLQVPSYLPSVDPKLPHWGGEGAEDDCPDLGDQCSLRIPLVHFRQGRFYSNSIRILGFTQGFTTEHLFKFLDRIYN